MSVTQDQIKKIAKNLCKLPSEEIKLIHDVNEILKYVEMLNEVDTTGVEPTISVVSKENTLREDIVSTTLATPLELLRCSPQKVVSWQITIGDIMN